MPASRAPRPESRPRMPDMPGMLGALGPAPALGIGVCLGDCDADDDERYAATITAAFRRGVTLVDTAINYRCQRAERAVGIALDRASDVPALVCTKGGYVPLESPPPATKAEYRAYVEREYVDSGIIQPDQLVDGGHCITPRFLADQIARSRRNLGRDTIDLYYVHNPERQLDAVGRDVLYERLRDTFAELEQQVADGAIRAYGCATWDALRVTPDHPMHLELELLVAAARDVAGDAHHFAAVQLPVSLAMTEAVRVPTQHVHGEPCTALQAAHALGVTVVVGATLLQGRLAHGLPAEVREAFPQAATDAQRALAFVAGIPGIASIAVGMRSEVHLEENLAVFA